MPKFINSNKLQNHLDRLLCWCEDGFVKPVTVEMHLSNACNQNCVYCSAKDVRGNKIMAMEKIKVGLINIKRRGAKAVIFSGGGEPLMNINFAYAVNMAVGLGLDVGVITNGALLNSSVINTILYKCVWVKVSLDVGSRSAYERIRGKDDFDKVISNIKLLIENKELTGSMTTIGVQAVVTEKSTLPELAEFYYLFREELGNVDYIQVRPEESVILNFTRDMERINRFVNDNALVDKRLIVSDKFDVAGMEKRPPCNAYQFTAAVDVQGDVYLCCHLVGKPHARYGNVFEEDDRWREKRHESAKSIDYAECPRMCRGSGINQYLDTLTNSGEHCNFL